MRSVYDLTEHVTKSYDLTKYGYERDGGTTRTCLPFPSYVDNGPGPLALHDVHTDPLLVVQRRLVCRWVIHNRRTIVRHTSAKQ